MDPLDFSIYRFLSPNGEARFWAGRRSIDPSVPAREIADRVGISENGVRARLRGLEERGVLRGRAVIPNPSLFGVRVYVAELPIQSAGEVARMFRDLALVEGVIFARDTMDEGNRVVRVHYVSGNEPTTLRRAALIRRLSSTGKLGSPQPYWIPECERELSALDWRILQAFCRHPDATVGETARAVGISLKTTARRYHELTDAHACWWTHGPDAEELPLALLRVELRGPEHRDPFAAWILRETSNWMPVAGDGLGLAPESRETVVAGLVPADAPAVLERLVQKIVDRPEVASARRTFALGSRSYPAWFTEQIAERVPVRS
jgi:DNA-binding Lrp family transcriptional regulator